MINRPAMGQDRSCRKAAIVMKRAITFPTRSSLDPIRVSSIGRPGWFLVAENLAVTMAGGVGLLA